MNGEGSRSVLTAVNHEARPKSGSRYLRYDANRGWVKVPEEEATEMILTGDWKADFQECNDPSCICEGYGAYSLLRKDELI